jgi:hypothetical protein
MFPGLRFTLLIPLAAILGCGVTPTPATTTSPSLSLSGNWMAIAPATPSTPPITLPTPIAEFTGALQFSGNAVTGTLRAFDPEFPNQCVSMTQDLPVSGTLDASNKLTLVVPISGGTATITATLGTNSETYTNGTWQIVGGACAMPVTSIVIAHYAPVTGTYTGTLNTFDITTLTIVPGTATSITAVLTQSTAPNADGQFPLTGTIIATGACSGNFTIANEAVSGGAITPISSLTNPQTAFLDGVIEPTATSIVAGFSGLAACNWQVYQGTLTRQ